MHWMNVTNCIQNHDIFQDRLQLSDIAFTADLCFWWLRINDALFVLLQTLGRMPRWLQVCIVEETSCRWVTVTKKGFSTEQAPCLSAQAFHLATMWYCTDWLNARWSDLADDDLTLCGTVLAGGVHNDLTTLWYCTDWWNAWWSDHHVVLYWLVECMMIWPGWWWSDFVWYCTSWWSAQWSDHHVVLYWLVEYTMIWPGWWWSDHHMVLYWLVECTMVWPPCVSVLTGGTINDLT